MNSRSSRFPESKENRLDLSSLIAVVSIVCLSFPFSHLWLLRLGFITLNLFELTNIIVFALLAVHIILYGIRPQFAAPFFMSVVIISIYCLISLIGSETNYIHIFEQARLFMPFVLATLIVASRISYDFEFFMKGIVFAALVSSISALVINFIFPQIVEASYQSNETVAYISTEGGRMRWDNDFSIFFIIAIFFATRRKTLLLWCSIISCAFALFAEVGRTQMVMAMVYLIVLYGLASAGALERIWKTFLIILSLLSISLLFYLILSQNSAFNNAFDIRFFGGGDVSNIYNTSIEINRVFLYQQYWDKLVSSFPFGQGLGIPVANNGINDVFITDVSLLSFMLPFGLVGVMLFISYLVAILKLIRESNLNSIFLVKLRYAVLHMLTIWLIISLNDDWFTRKMSVVYLALFVVFMHSNRDRMLVNYQ